VKIGGLSFILGVATSCSGIQNEMPDTNEAQERAALAEIESYPLPPSTNAMSGDAAQQMLFNVYARIKPAAFRVCIHLDETPYCAWQIQYDSNGEFNAYALPGNTVYVSYGLIAGMDSEEEVAFALAHELSHHIADHLSESRKQMSAGALAAGAAMAAATHGVGACVSYACQTGLRQAANSSINAGGYIADQTFNKKQEKEADYLAAYILNLAGYDLSLSRTALVKIGAMVDDRTTNFTDTHPAGPERLANYDVFVELVQNDLNGLPGEDQIKEEQGVIEGTSPTVSRDEDSNVNGEDPKKCRLYLPADDICIY